MISAEANAARAPDAPFVLAPEPDTVLTWQGLAASCHTFAAAMEEMIRARKVKALVVVAPPRTLAELRDAFHPDVKACIIAEINKDLTKHPVFEIEKHLTGDTVSH